jgi:glycosyltransferase involved in cell wall biosynthesis
VSLVAAAHAEMLVELRHDVAILGAHKSVLQEMLPVSRRYHVQARGSGSLYSPAHVDHDAIATVIKNFEPRLVVVEAWQTALTDATVDVAYRLKVPVLMVSHGVSVHPFSSQPLDRIRALGWLPYRHYRLPRLVSKLSGLTTLAEKAASPRFQDRDLAARLGKPVQQLGNFPIHWLKNVKSRTQRKPQILVVGYFSAIKNQLAALEVLRRLPPELTLRFVGRRDGAYYQHCVKRAKEWGLAERVIFAEDHECSLAEEIGGSLMLLSTSLTEALPICLIEAMACGTPFVATPVGAVPDLGAGLLRLTLAEQVEAVLAFLNDPGLWAQQSQQGFLSYRARYTRERVKQGLAAAVNSATKQW